MINTIQIAVSGMHAASRRAEASAANIANATTTGAIDAKDGPAPYQAVTTTQTAITPPDGSGGGVRADIVAASRPFHSLYAPDSPFAGQDGMIGAPSVDYAAESVNSKLASHSYKANASVIKTASDMQDALLGMFDRKA